MKDPLRGYPYSLKTVPFFLNAWKKICFLGKCSLKGYPYPLNWTVLSWQICQNFPPQLSQVSLQKTNFAQLQIFWIFSTGNVFQNNKKMRKVEPQESFFDLEIKQKAVWCLHFNASCEQRSGIVQVLFKILQKEFSPWLHWKWTKAFQSKFRNFYHSISSWYHFEIVLPKIFFQSLAQIAPIPILAFLHNFPIVSFLNCA